MFQHRRQQVALSRRGHLHYMLQLDALQSFTCAKYLAVMAEPKIFYKPTEKNNVFTVIFQEKLPAIFYKPKTYGSSLVKNSTDCQCYIS